MTPAVAPHRQPVHVLLILANACRPRRPAGSSVHTETNPLTTYRDALDLVAPLHLSQPLTEDELDDLADLIREVHALSEALAEGQHAPSIRTLNRLAQQATATRTLNLDADGKLTAHVDWTADSAVAEIASGIVDELGRLDPTRLRRCSREACTLLFYDTTRPGTQRWHSDSPCGLRERQTRHRHPTTR